MYRATAFHKMCLSPHAYRSTKTLTFVCCLIANVSTFASQPIPCRDFHQQRLPGDGVPVPSPNLPTKQRQSGRAKAKAKAKDKDSAKSREPSKDKEPWEHPL